MGGVKKSILEAQKFDVYVTFEINLHNNWIFHFRYMRFIDIVCSPSSLWLMFLLQLQYFYQFASAADGQSMRLHVN